VRDEDLPSVEEVLHVALRSGGIVLPAVLHERVVPRPCRKLLGVIESVRLRPRERVRSSSEGQVVPRVQIFHVAVYAKSSAHNQHGTKDGA
jgi:hypothetical protein